MLRFEELYDIHHGNTALILGNGPSLKDMAGRVAACKYPTFGSNRVYLLGGGFCPTYYACVNPLVIDQNMHDIIGLSGCSMVFLAGDWSGEGVYPLRSVPAPMFSYNPASYVYEGYTVTFVLLQLAFFMGFSTALLAGVDHRYVYDGEPNEQHEMSGDDPNHFDPSYFRGQQWNNPDLDRSAEAYQMARAAFEADHRRIINITPGSALDVFEKESADKWL